MGAALAIQCTCGTSLAPPEVVDTGIRPSERLAEKLRFKAFRAAGLVRNVGGFALGCSLLGILFFPLGIVGALVGTYVLTMIRGPLGRYSGRRQAILAIAIGVSAFFIEGAIAISYVEHRAAKRVELFQTSVTDDLRALLRTQRLYFASYDAFGTFKDFRYVPRHGLYTLYLGPTDTIAAMRDKRAIVDPLPANFAPHVKKRSFMAVAVANLDDDPDFDVWTLDDKGEIIHAHDDSNLVRPRVADSQ